MQSRNMLIQSLNLLQKWFFSFSGSGLNFTFTGNCSLLNFFAVTFKNSCLDFLFAAPMYLNLKVWSTLSSSSSLGSLYKLFVSASLSGGLSDAPGRTATFTRKDCIRTSVYVIIFILNMDACHVNTKGTCSNIRTATYFMS